MTLNSPFTVWEGDNVHGRRAVLTGVSIRLDRLFARVPGTPRHVIETGLDLTGSVDGRLHGRFPSVDGDWLGVVNYEIGYADGRRDKLHLVDQLVPFHVLRKRD
ncbi:hypothetical protein AB0A63_00175 [Lentzea sp. NPDC042327]|uniref:hypothetical protein n=1 Tax=Lentzea sp. NPDC042327 TaxID=3154801 RepID=UPI0033C921E6